MIRSDLYRRRTLLGNGDDGWQCRDAHREGQTIDHRRKSVSPQGAGRKIQIESGSIDHGSRRLNHACMRLQCPLAVVKTNKNDYRMINAQ